MNPPQSPNENFRKPIKYIRDLPAIEREKLCKSVDAANKWRELGRYMKFGESTLYSISQTDAFCSKTDELLNEMVTRNVTVAYLFESLCGIRQYHAAKIIKPFVDPSLHRLIDNYDISPIWEVFESEVRKNNEDKKTIELTLSECMRLISYEELQEASDSWNRQNTLGEGAFGVVYKGTWKNTKIAIKRLKSQFERNFENKMEDAFKELKCLNYFKHDNILPIYGYSIDGPEPCLAYQYMRRGSLDANLRCENVAKVLSWSKRMKIGIGVACGLQFLHNREIPLIHGDIKSGNILLDANFIPKIGDFGCARDGPIRTITHVTEDKLQGTAAYLPPEYLRSGKLSVKVDTYSFGVVLLELATGKNAYKTFPNNRSLRDFCHETQYESLETLKDARVGNKNYYYFWPLMNIGKMCSNTSRKDRPTMSEAYEKLDELKSFVVGSCTNSSTRRTNNADPQQNRQLENLVMQFTDNFVSQAGSTEIRNNQRTRTPDSFQRAN